MNRKTVALCLLAVTLLWSLTACKQQVGIIGGADGPTSVFVTDGDTENAIIIGPDGEVTTPANSADDTVSDTDSADDTASDTDSDGGTETPTDADTTSQADADAEPAPDGIPATPEEPPVPLTLAMLSGAWAEAVRAELPAFEQGNHVTCEVRELSRDELRAALSQTDTAYDLIMVHSSSVAACRKTNALASLSALGYRPGDDFIPSVLDICADGSAYTLAPWYGNATVLLCNKQSLIASDSSTDRIQNLQNLLAVCKAAKQRGEIGFVYHQSHEDRVTLDFLPILRSFDGWFVDHNQKPSVYTKKFQDAVNFFLELTATGKALPDSEFVKAIDSGKAAVGFIRSDWYTPSAKSAATYIVFPGAAEKGGETHPAGTCTIWGLGIPANSQHPEQAERLLEYLMHPSIQRNLIASGVTPCRYSLLQDAEILKSRPHYAKVAAAMEQSQYVPTLTEWPEMADILGEELWKVMAGRKKVTEALDDAQKRMEALLAGEPRPDAPAEDIP
ncbi:MAG: extracellular solute-binding protein [Oscillibacter sp.]|nr:extracellular solute-binding protein [Oscillibacter sp.]